MSETAHTPTAPVPTWPANAARILHFTLGWAGPCKTFTNVILSRVVAAGLTLPVETYDVDQHQDLARSHDIRCVPTLIMVDAEGQTIGRLLGMRPEPTFRAWLSAPGVEYPL